MTTARARGADVAAALALFVAAAIIVQQSTTWPEAADVAGNPTVFPRVVAALMALVGALLLARPLPLADEESDAAGLKRILLALAATLLLALSLEGLGLIPAGFLYVLALQRIAGAPMRIALPFAMAAPVVIWLAFATVLRVPLPWGRVLPALGL